MTYTLSFEIERFTSPVTIVFDGLESEYENGKTAVANVKLDKPVLIEEIFCRDNRIVIVLKENDKAYDTSWCNGSDASFF